MINLDFNLERPECKRSFEQKFQDTSPGKSRKCPFCGINIIFEGDDISKIEKEINNLLSHF